MLLIRLLRLAVGLFSLLVVLAVAAVWISVARNAGRAAEASISGWGGILEHGSVHPRLFPPAAVVEGLSVKAADGSELFKAERCVLPLPPRAWLGEGTAGSPRLEGFTARFIPLSRWRETLAGTSLPGLGDWSATRGSVDLGPLSLEEVEISRNGDRIELSGQAREGKGRVSLHGRWKSGELTGLLSAQRLPAPALSPWVVDPSRSTVRGGSFQLEGSLAVSRALLRFDGRLGARQMLIEGEGESGPVELALRLGGGSASFPFLYQLSLDSSDWEAAARVALAAGAPRARHGG